MANIYDDIIVYGHPVAEHNLAFATPYKDSTMRTDAE